MHGTITFNILLSLYLWTHVSSVHLVASFIFVFYFRFDIAFQSNNVSREFAVVFIFRIWLSAVVFGSAITTISVFMRLKLIGFVLSF